MSQVSSSKTRIIVLCGPESTGKSSLCDFLSHQLKAPGIQEIARDYIEKLDRTYTYEDVEEIARLQIQAMDKALAMNPEYLILDTWLIITKVWFEVVFKREPDWLENSIKKYPVSLFLLCEPDLPWVYDPIRENPNRREELFNKYQSWIEKYNFPYRIVNGQGKIRENCALKHIENLQKELR